MTGVRFWLWAIGAVAAFGMGLLIAAQTEFGTIALALLLVADIALLATSDRAGAESYSDTSAPKLDSSTTEPKLNLQLVLLPTVAAMQSAVKVQLAVVAVLVLVTVIRNKPAEKSARDFTRGPGLALLMCIALTLRDGPYLRAAIVAGLVMILISVSRTVNRKVASESIFAGMVLYLVANLLAWAIGFGPDRVGRREGARVGFPPFDGRIDLPLTVGANEASYVAAAVLVAFFAMIRKGQRPSWYHWLGVGGGVIALLADGSRTPVILLATLAPVIYIAPSMTRRLAPYIAATGLLLPFYYLLVQSSLMPKLADLIGAGVLARQNSTDQIATVSGRDGIWSSITGFWFDRVRGVLHQLFGFGVRGQVRSEAYEYIPQNLTRFLKDRTSITAHNSILQALLDTGIFGAIILFSVAVLVVYRYSQMPQDLPMCALATVLVLSGALETNLVAGFGQIPGIVLMCLAFFTPKRSTVSGRGSNPYEFRPRAVDPMSSRINDED